MDVFDILNLILGLAFFLFGIRFMGDALKEGVRKKQNQFMHRLTEKSGRGFLLGAGVTAVIQSSSATTVMVVSLVNSGVLSLYEAAGVIFGANVGTSATSFLTALAGIEKGSGIHSLLQWLKPSSFVPILAIVGLFFYVSGDNKSKQRKQVGSILLGFCILMSGMSQMSDSVKELQYNESFQSVLLMFEHPLLGVLAGAILTAIIQSSSASIGILQSLTATGAITFGNAIPIIMGQNIGTCITAIIASLGSNRDAKRVGMIHLLFNVLGTAFGILIFYILRVRIHVSVLNGAIDMWGIAIAHLVFNIGTVILLYPLRKKLIQLTFLLVPKNKK